MALNIFKRVKHIKTGILLRNILFAVLLVLVTVGIFAFGTISWGFYKLDWRGPIIEKIMKAMPMPLARVGNAYVWSNDYYIDLESARQYYAKQKEAGAGNIPTDLELRKIILENRLIKNLIILQIAKKYKITVSGQDIDASMDEVIKNKGGEDAVEKFLRDYYHLDIYDYKKYFIKPNLLFDKTNEAVIDDESINGEAKKKIQEALAELRNGAEFEDVAKKYTEEKDPLGNTILKENFLRGELPKDIEDQLFNMKEGEYTDVLTLPSAFAIFKLNKKDETNGVLGLGKIIVKIKTLEDILPDEKQKTQIDIYAY